MTAEKPSPYTERTSCACCKACWRDPKTGRCMHGGPFAGYTTNEGKRS